MSQLPTPAELATVAKGAYRSAIDPGGTGAVDLQPGSRNDVALSVAAAMSHRVSLYAADRVTASRLASASGEDLDVLARDWYGVTRKAGNAATGYLRLVRGTTGVTVIPAGSRLGVPATASQRAITFVVSRDVSVASADALAVVPVTCSEAGVAGNIVGPAAVTSILDVLPDTGWSLDPSYLPDTPFGGGSDDEQDDELRARLRLTTPQAAKQRGTREAILTGALNVPGVAYATPVEPQDGTVRLYAGDASFNLTDVAALAIQTELLAWRSMGVPVVVLPYAVTDVQVTAAIYMARPLSNYNVGQLVADATAAVTEYFETRPQPDEYYTEAVIAAIFRAHAEVQHVVLTYPSASVTRPADTGYGVVSSLNRYRVRASTIALTVNPPNTL